MAMPESADKHANRVENWRNSFKIAHQTLKGRCSHIKNIIFKNFILSKFDINTFQLSKKSIFLMLLFYIYIHKSVWYKSMTKDKYKRQKADCNSQ